MNRIKKIRTFYYLSKKQKLLFFRAFFLSALVRFVTLYFPMRFWYKQFIGEQSTFHTYDNLKQIDKVKLKEIVQMIRLACRYAPWQAKCLVESILIKKLSGKKYNLPIYLGLNKKENKYLAHAWVHNEINNNNLYKIVSVHV